MYLLQAHTRVNRMNDKSRIIGIFIGMVIIYIHLLFINTVNSNIIIALILMDVIAFWVGLFLLRKMHFLAYYNVLTGLPNRNYLEKYFNLLLKKSKEQRFAVMLLAVNNFELINDTLGYDCGDMLLKEISVRLKENKKKSGQIFRCEGEKFVIIADYRDKSEIAELAQGLLDLFILPFKYEEYEIFASVRIGISLFPQDESRSIMELIRKANLAIFYIKEQGSQLYQFYFPELSKNYSERMLLANDLKKALENNEFIICYQPQVELSTGRIIGIEALIRWNHPIKGMIPPSDFIPIAEETGLIIPIGRWVLEHSIRQFKYWYPDGIPPLRLAVNVSVKQFKDVHLIRTVKNILEKTKLSPQHLELEITESIMQNIEESKRLLHQLKKMGVRISLDDFGTGYSSLSVLKDLPIDTLKIDRQFLSDLFINSNAEAIVKTIMDIGNNLKVTIIAEGIENEEQLTFLKQVNCLFGQGYLFGQPLPQEEVMKKIP